MPCALSSAAGKHPCRGGVALTPHQPWVYQLRLGTVCTHCSLVPQGCSVPLLPSYTLKHRCTFRTISDFSISDLARTNFSISNLSITTISLLTMNTHSANKSELLIALLHSVALSEPSSLLLCLVTPLCFQVCAAAVSKRIKLQLFGFGFRYRFPH